MTISIIAAMAKNRVIGIGNSLPWDIPEDMAHFKKMTMGKTIIMGQKTFESIGGALPGRKNIVLTRDKNFHAEGCFLAGSIEESLNLAKNDDEVMIIGGASIYQQFLPLAQKMYLTLINHDFPGDVFFPEFSYNEWKEVSRIENEDSNLTFRFDFTVLERIKN